jgi:hypothetical protein
MDENYDRLREFDLDTLHRERPILAKVQKGSHTLRWEISDLGYSIEAEPTIRTREYFIIQLHNAKRFSATP